MHLFVGNGGRSIFVKRLVDEKRKDVKLKTYSDTKRAGLVLSMSRKKGLSVEDVVKRLAFVDESPLNDGEALLLQEEVIAEVSTTDPVEEVDCEITDCRKCNLLEGCPYSPSNPANWEDV